VVSKIAPRQLKHAPECFRTRLMTATISDVLRDAGCDIASNGAQDLAARLNAALGSVLTAFYVGPGTMVDRDGAQSARFETLIATEPPDDAGLVPADTVACAIYTCSALEAPQLAEGFTQLAEMRRLHKSPSGVDSRSTITLGLIVAAKTSLSLAAVATKMRELNETVTLGERPDMVVVLAKGTVHYGMSLPGDDSVGDFLPPVQSPKLVPPINVRQVVTLTPTHALNKACGLMIGHTAFFAPTAPRPDLHAATAGVPANCEIVWTYRYGASGEMSDAVSTSDLSTPAFRIDDPQGNLLCRLAYQPWQNGGVVIAEGQLPLEGLLPLAGFPMWALRLKNGHQVSPVLPIDAPGFVRVVGEITKKTSGVNVRQEQPQYIIAPLLDEGTSSPFAARVLMGLVSLRDYALTDKATIAEFDQLFQFVWNNLVDVRKTSRELLLLWRSHANRAASGEIARYENAIYIAESIDQPLNRHIDSFVTSTARVSKEFQKLTKLLGIDIGFLFQKEVNYTNALAALEASDPILAAYLRECRKWLEPLRLFRDEIEHENYVWPRIKYDRAVDGQITAREPRLLGLPLSTAAPEIENRLNRFVEEVLVWCIAKSLPSPMIVTEIPRAARDPNKVERFRVTLEGSAPAWELAFSTAAFEDV